MKIAFTDKERVLRSPYYMCNRLWDKLNSVTQLSKSMSEFKNNVKKIYCINVIDIENEATFFFTLLVNCSVKC